MLQKHREHSIWRETMHAPSHPGKKRSNVTNHRYGQEEGKPPDLVQLRLAKPRLQVIMQKHKERQKTGGGKKIQ